MSRLPVVVIVGRPNVGKSSFFNHVAGQLISIVEPTPGVTRDRVSAVVQLADRQVELVDTGGIGITDDANLAAHVEAQVMAALALADVVIVMTDAREGVVPLDRLVADRIRRLGKPIVLAVNKADSELFEEMAMELYALGLGEPVPMSVHQRYNTTEVLDRVRAHLDALAAEISSDPAGEPPPADLRLAVVGKRNAGKSTFVNALAGEERVITSEIPGTTRDAVDVRIERGGRAYVVVDTAGMRRKQAVEGDIEFYALVRTERAIRNADVVLLMLEAPADISTVDQHIATLALESYKPIVILLNKWDQAKATATISDFRTFIDQELPGLAFAPLVVTTALDGRNVWKAIEKAEELHAQSGMRIGTAEVNRVVAQAVIQKRPFASAHRTRTGKIFYGTQVDVRPPTFVLMVNNRSCFDSGYERYLANAFRRVFPMANVPIRFIFKTRAPARTPAGEDDDDEHVDDESE